MSIAHSVRQVSPAVLQQLRGIDSCTVSNAVERLDVRLRNEGFTNRTVRCLSPALSPMVGYAATGRIRTSTAPAMRHWYYERMDWWDYLLTIPEPRVIVLKDVDKKPGLGALFGEVHARISRAMGCAGYVTNGTVRDLPGITRVGMPVFAAGLSVSHAYAHVVDYGEPVEIGGLTISPGDLLHGDLHGVVAVPVEIAAEIPPVAAHLLAHERELFELCEPANFSLGGLRALIERAKHGAE